MCYIWVYVWFIFNKGDALNRFTRLKGFFAFPTKEMMLNVCALFELIYSWTREKYVSPLIRRSHWNANTKGIKIQLHFWCISMIIYNVSCKWRFGECKITLKIAEGMLPETVNYKLIVFETLILYMQVYLYFHRKCWKLSCTKISALHDWSNLITQQRVLFSFLKYPSRTFLGNQV